MPHAILTPEGTIRQLVPKLLPTLRLAPGERIVAYNPPAVDAELQTCTPVLPVPAEAQAVQFVVADRPDALARAVRRAHAEIDNASGQARARYITVVPGQEATYMRKDRQARDYRGAGYPADATPWPLVLAEARSVSGNPTPTALELQQGADGIIAQADAWIVLAAQIEQVRRTAKIAALAGTNPASITAAAHAACVTLCAI